VVKCASLPLLSSASGSVAAVGAVQQMRAARRSSPSPDEAVGWDQELATGQRA
jgi:hypothetical protein